MALVTQVSNLRTYNLKFSDFGIDQAVEQPIPVEPGRTISKRAETVSTGALGDIITDTRDLEVGRRKDDATRLKAFLTSGKGVLFASKQAGLDQDLSLELNPRKRLTDAANTAARLANILLQAGSSGTGVRLSSNPFGRYIEARGLFGQIGNLIQPRDAPFLAKRGKPIIPDYEARENSEARETTGGEEDGFFRGIARRLKIIRDVNSIVEDIDDDSTSLKKRLETPDSPGSKFDKDGGYTGYVVGPAPGSRDDSPSSTITNLTVQDITDTPLELVVKPVDNRVNKKSLKKRFETSGGTGLTYGTKLNLGQPVIPEESDVTLTIRENSKNARRNGSGNFPTPTPYLTSPNDLTQAFDSDVSKIKIDIFTPIRPEGPTLTVSFDAFIDSFSDNYSGNWSGTNYIGRAEPVYNYTGFNRDYSFNFKVASFSVNELKDLYQRLNALVGITAPTYNDTFMRGTFVRLKIGDYLDSTPGFISSIGFSWNTTYPWQAQKDEKVRGGIYEDVPLLPHVLDVSCNFTPIHNFIPQTNIDLNDISSPYIASTNLNLPLTLVPPETSTAVPTETEQSSQGRGDTSTGLF